MGYRISYENGGIKTPVHEKKMIQKGTVVKLSICIVSLCLVGILHQSKELRRCFIPGNPDVTEAAVTELVDSIRQGDRFEDAITTFCRHIIDNGE